MPLLLFLNLGGLLSAVMIFLAVGALLTLGPSFENTVSGDLVISLIVLAVGGSMEFTPLRPRIFAIPVWFVGLGMTAWHLSKIWF